MLPNFIIIGAQKSASTLLHHCLSEHPDVFIPAKELAFFQNPDYLNNSLEKFEQLFEPGYGKKALGMRRAEYLYRPECPSRILQHIPSAKLIVILRDPVERAISAYYHYARSGFGPIKHVNEGLWEVINGRYVEQYPRAAEIIEYGFYHKHLSRYLDYFDRSQILVVLYDDLIKNPDKLLLQTLKFLGISEIHPFNFLASRPQAGVYSLFRLRLLTLRNPFLYTYSSNRERRFLKEKINPLASLFVKSISLVDNKILSRVVGNTKPVLSQELRTMLASTYCSDTAKLEKLFDFDLRHWQVFQNI